MTLPRSPSGNGGLPVNQQTHSREWPWRCSVYCIPIHNTAIVLRLGQLQSVTLTVTSRQVQLLQPTATINISDSCWVTPTDGLHMQLMYSVMSVVWMLVPFKSTTNKKAELSQRWPRDAPNVWALWKFSGVPDNAYGYFSRIFNGFCSDWAHKCACKIWNP